MKNIILSVFLLFAHMKLLSLSHSNWRRTDTQAKVTSSFVTSRKTPILATSSKSNTTEVTHEHQKSTSFGSKAGNNGEKFDCCYTPLRPPIKDAGDGCRRGCQSGRGPWGEQKAGGGVAQPWPGHNDQGLTLQTYHHTHASNRDTHREGGRVQRGSEVDMHTIYFYFF